MTDNNKKGELSENSSPLKERRRFLGMSLGILGSAFAAGIIYPVLSYLQPPKKNKKGEAFRISKRDLPPGGMQQFHLGEIPAVAINSKEGFAAFSLVCSHLGCLVKWEGNENEFLCPCHGAKFDSRGNVISGPPPTGLAPFNVTETEDEIWIS